jgi:hypothetical protein
MISINHAGKYIYKKPGQKYQPGFQQNFCKNELVVKCHKQIVFLVVTFWTYTLYQQVSISPGISPW